VPTSLWVEVQPLPIRNKQETKRYRFMRSSECVSPTNDLSPQVLVTCLRLTASAGKHKTPLRRGFVVSGYLLNREVKRGTTTMHYARDTHSHGRTNRYLLLQTLYDMKFSNIYLKILILTVVRMGIFLYLDT